MEKFTIESDEITTVYDLRQAMNRLVQAMVDQGQSFTAEQMGLDPRSSYGQLTVTADEGAIIVNSSSARVLNYYGGFEYVDNKSVMDLGDWVIYEADDNRVQGHIDTALGRSTYHEEDDQY